MYRILGIEKFKGKDGRSWCKLYVGFQDNNVVGMKTRDVFTSLDMVDPEISVGCDVHIYLGLDGRIQAIVKA